MNDFTAYLFLAAARFLQMLSLHLLLKEPLLVPLLAFQGLELVAQLRDLDVRHVTAGAEAAHAGLTGALVPAALHIYEAGALLVHVVCADVRHVAHRPEGHALL